MESVVESTTENQEHEASVVYVDTFHIPKNEKLDDAGMNQRENGNLFNRNTFKPTSFEFLQFSSMLLNHFSVVFYAQCSFFICFFFCREIVSDRRSDSRVVFNEHFQGISVLISCNCVMFLWLCDFFFFRKRRGKQRW